MTVTNSFEQRIIINFPKVGDIDVGEFLAGRSPYKDGPSSIVVPQGLELYQSLYNYCVRLALDKANFRSHEGFEGNISFGPQENYRTGIYKPLKTLPGIGSASSLATIVHSVLPEDTTTLRGKPILLDTYWDSENPGTNLERKLKKISRTWKGFPFSNSVYVVAPTFEDNVFDEVADNYNIMVNPVCTGYSNRIEELAQLISDSQ